MTKAEKCADFAKCIRLLKSRAKRCLSLGDEAGANRALETAVRFYRQMAELMVSVPISGQALKQKSPLLQKIP